MTNANTANETLLQWQLKDKWERLICMLCTHSQNYSDFSCLLHHRKVKYTHRDSAYIRIKESHDVTNIKILNKTAIMCLCGGGGFCGEHASTVSARSVTSPQKFTASVFFFIPESYPPPLPPSLNEGGKRHVILQMRMMTTVMIWRVMMMIWQFWPCDTQTIEH